MKKLILLPLALILFAAPMADDLLVEGFETGVLPTDWQVWEEEPMYWYSWYFGLGYGGHSGTEAAGRYYGVCYPGYGYPGDDSWLVTPTLDMTGYENLSFSCWYELWSWGTANPDVHVMGSNVPSPGPSDFVELLDMGPPPGSYEERVADASAFADESDVTFAIRYEATQTDTFSYGIWIDDVLVTGDVIPAVESASLGEIKAIYR